MPDQKVWVIAQTLMDRANRMDVDRLTCEACSRGASTDVAKSMRSLVEHALTEHGRPVSLYAEVAELFAPAYALALGAGLPPRTETEKRWREDPKERQAAILQRMLAETQRHNLVLAELSAELDELAKEDDRG